jgi:hypothetical protein
MYAAAKCRLMLAAADIDLTVGTTCFE